MTDIIEAAARALCDVADYRIWEDPCKAKRLAAAVLAAITPLIRAAALEQAAQVAEDYVARLEVDPGEDIATAIRALKEQP